MGAPGNPLPGGASSHDLSRRNPARGAGSNEAHTWQGRGHQSSPRPRFSQAKNCSVLPGYVDFQRINQAAIAALPGVLSRIVPGGKTIKHEYVALNPTRADRHLGSFRINLKTGRWADFATSDRGGDPVSLCAMSKAARKWKARGAWPGCSPSIPGGQASWMILMMVAMMMIVLRLLRKANSRRLNPGPAPMRRKMKAFASYRLPPMRRPCLKPSRRWPYRDADAALLFEVWRLDSGSNSCRFRFGVILPARSIGSGRPSRPQGPACGQP
jgi:hypothetical protein